MPSKTVLIRPTDKPGMTGAVRTLFRKCQRLHKKANNSKLPHDVEQHKLARCAAKRARRHAKNNWHVVIYLFRSGRFVSYD